MSVLRGDYTGCPVLIYSSSGDHLIDTMVTFYDRIALRIGIETPPPELRIGDACRVLIVTTPSPCEYQGRVAKEGAGFAIAMYQGHEKEDRGTMRYSVKFHAQIENLISDGRACPLPEPLNIKLIDISKSGVRFYAPTNCLGNGDRFQMRMKIGEADKLLIADTVHHIDKGLGMSEYGCKFLIATKG